MSDTDFELYFWFGITHYRNSIPHDAARLCSTMVLQGYDGTEHDARCNQSRLSGRFPLIIVSTTIERFTGVILARGVLLP